MKHWILVALIGCGNPDPSADSPPPAEPAAAEAPPHGATPPAGPAPAAQGRVAVVREVINAERYTYARMDACGQEAWVAGPNMALEVGSTVLMDGGAPMTNFTSKALDRTFDMILFVDGWKVADKPLLCEPSKPAPEGNTAEAPKKEGASTRTGVVVETMDSGGYTYVLLDVCGTQEWVAGPARNVKVGQTLATAKGSAMTSFRSNSLDRTFETIYFVQAFLPPAGPPDCG